MANTPPVDPSLNPTRGSWDGSWMNIPGLIPVNIGSSDPYPVNFQSAQRGKYTPTNTAWGNSPDNNNTTQFDPFGTALGPQIGDLLAALTKALSTKPADATTPAPATPDPVQVSATPEAQIPALAPVPVSVPQPTKRVVNASTSQEGNQIYQPDSSSQYDPAQFGYQAQPTQIDYPYQQGGSNPTVTAQEGDQLYQPYQVQANGSGYTPTAADITAGARTPHVGPQAQFNFNGYSTPNDSTFGASPTFTGANAAQAGLNAAGYFVPGLNILAGLGQGFNLFGQAPGTGNTIADVVGTSGIMQNTAANIGNWINRQFGGSYMPDSYAAPTLGGPSQPGGPDWNQAVAAARGNSNAVLDGAYGYTGKDASLGDVKGQLAGLTTLPTFDNTQMGWTGQPMYNMGGADLFNSIGASPLSWQDRGGAENMPNYGYGNSPQFAAPAQNTGPSVDDLNRWASLNSTGNRWDN